ncbi:hypothetical protein [Tautonia plasticadhaerens]|nr:hypothetical protein [Tautonia plasticadhaerens]
MIPPPNSPAPLSGVRLARVPIAGLAALAALRGRGDVTVLAAEGGEDAWVSWRPGPGGDRDEVVEALLPVPGAAFFRGDRGGWYRVGRSLPDFDAGPAPEGDHAGPPGLPLHRALLPGPTRWLDPRADWRPATLRLAADHRPRPASALVIRAGALLPWAESAPTASLRGLAAARSGDRVLLLGRRLPPVLGLGRYWGGRVLVPLGSRPEPDLPEARMAEALGLPDGDLGLIGPDGRVEVVPGRAPRPLSRASARLMAGISDRLPGGQGPGSGPREGGR